MLTHGRFGCWPRRSRTRNGNKLFFLILRRLTLAKAVARSTRMIRQGLYLALGGLVLSFGTLALAGYGGGGVYVVAWGHVVVGVLQIVRGLVLAGTKADGLEMEAPRSPLLSQKRCPSCKTPFSEAPAYCPRCGRYLRA